MFDSDRKLNLTVPDEILCELGKIVVFQSHIESMLAHEIIGILGLDSNKGQIITSELSFKLLVSTLSSLLLDKLGGDNNLYIEFKEIKKQLYEFENFRNSIAHSNWTHSNDFDNSKATKIKTTSKERTGLKYHREEVALSSLIENLEKAGDTQVKLAFLMSKISGVEIKHIDMTNKKSI